MEKGKRHSKAKIVFILTIIFVVVTIGCFIYKNNCNQQYDEYWEEHLTDDIALKNHRINQSEFDLNQKRKTKLEKASDTADKIFIVSTGVTVISLVSGIVILIVEKKKNK